MIVSLLKFVGEYCEVKVDQPCPSSWWGYPVCGPCHCDVVKGYNADCNKTTGECYCKVSAVSNYTVVLKYVMA